tara:strand:+ start:382 stop:588 length:207 start_codon:yes stop_codon:yes gene_type:complete
VLDVLLSDWHEVNALVFHQVKASVVSVAIQEYKVCEIQLKMVAALVVQLALVVDEDADDLDQVLEVLL